MWNEYVYSYSAKKLSLFHRPGVGVLNIGPVNSNCGNWRGIVVDLLGIGTGVTPEVSEQADEGKAGVHTSFFPTAFTLSAWHVASTSAGVMLTFVLVPGATCAQSRSYTLAGSPETTQLLSSSQYPSPRPAAPWRSAVHSFAYDDLCHVCHTHQSSHTVVSGSNLRRGRKHR